MADWKLVVTCVLWKRLDNSSIVILTQRRLVKDPNYDPFYHNKWEAVGETFKPGEGIEEVVLRGLQEECGYPDNDLGPISGIPDREQIHSVRGERMIAVMPLCYLHSIGKPQLWTGPAFLIEMSRDFEPHNRNSEGEVGDYRWWPTRELLAELTTNPNEFCSFDRLALEMAAFDLRPHG